MKTFVTNDEGRKQKVSEWGSIKGCTLFGGIHGLIIRDPWWVVLVRHEYLNNYITDLQNFGISLKLSYLSLRWYKEIAKIRIFNMFILLAKITGSSKILLLPSGTHGVMLFRHNYLKIFLSYFYKLGNSLKRSYISFRWCKENFKNRDFSMFLLPSKFAGSSKFWLKFCRTHGGYV